MSAHRIRLAIDTSYMDRRPGKGTAIVIRHTVEELLKRTDEFDITLIHKERIPEDPLYEMAEEIIIPRVPLPKFSGFISEFWFFLTTRKHFDVYYFSYSRLYPTFWLAPASRIVWAAMDGGPQTAGYGGKAKGRQPWYVRMFFNRINAYVALTAFGKRGIEETYGLPEEKIHTVPNGVDERFFASHEIQNGSLSTYGIEEPYILCVSRFDPHKNILRLLEAFKSLRDAGRPERLVFVGGRHMPDYSDEVDRKITELGLTDLVLIAPYIPDGVLPQVYAHAKLMVFPSLYEGFGLPVIESMASGTPVVVSNIDALTEVSGGIAEVVDPYGVGSIASGMLRLLTDDALRQERIKEGKKWVRRYTWQAHGEAIAAVLSGSTKPY